MDSVEAIVTFKQNKRILILLFEGDNANYCLFVYSITFHCKNFIVLITILIIIQFTLFGYAIHFKVIIPRRTGLGDIETPRVRLLVCPSR